MTTDEQQDWGEQFRAELMADLEVRSDHDREEYLLMRCVELHMKLIAARNTIVDLRDNAE